MYHGILLVDKPTGVTSHDVVSMLRKTLKQKGIGHTGTLDPLAEGLMVICLGRATKVTRFLSGLNKTYEAAIHLGLRSRTFDAEGIDTEAVPEPIPEVTGSEIDELLAKFMGRQMQQVPAYSAVQVGGQRLYKLARKGEAVERPEREIEIFDITRLSYSKPLLRISVACSSGTYIRSLANDFGERLGCGAYLSGLRRTAVGRFRLGDSLSLEEIGTCHKAGSLTDRLIAIEDILPFGVITVTEEFSQRVIEGRNLTARDIARVEGNFSAGEQVVLKNTEGMALAIGRAQLASAEIAAARGRQLFTYERVLN